MSEQKITAKILNNQANLDAVKDICRAALFSRTFSQWEKIPDLPDLLKMLGYDIATSGDIMQPTIDILSWEGNEQDLQAAFELINKMEIAELGSGTIYREGDVEYLSKQIANNPHVIASDILMANDRQFRQSLTELSAIIAQRNRETCANIIDDIIAVLRDPFAASQTYPSNKPIDDISEINAISIALMASLAGIGKMLIDGSALYYEDAIDKMVDRGCFVWLAIYFDDIAHLTLTFLPCLIMMGLVESGREIDMGTFSLGGFGI